MRDHDPPGLAAAMEGMRQQPFLSDFAVALPRLAGPGADDLSRSFARLGELVKAAQSPVTARFRVVEGERERTWTVETGRQRSAVSEESDRPADVVVIVSAASWRAIASGDRSPLEAFGRGELRVQGDVQAAWRLLRSLRATDPG